MIFHHGEVAWTSVYKFHDWSMSRGDSLPTTDNKGDGRICKVSYGPSTPLLQSLALKLLNQPCSSSCYERNWSMYAFIQGLKRNKLQLRRTQDLVYVHTNLRLLARKSSSYYKDNDSMWDLGGDDHDSMEQGNIDVLEMATLSLDVSALERMVFDDEMET
ncbi:hypothetical protein ACLB2K_064176 [Fragaria x ananassa]